MTSPGWYPAQGDPPNTERYWDGNAWLGTPRARQAPVSEQEYQPSATGGEFVPGPGWYRADGDPFGTVRYWDGQTWSSAPVPAPTMGFMADPGEVVKLSPLGYWIKGWTRSYANFSARSRRAEYGWFALINIAIFVALIFGFIAIGIDADAEELNGAGVSLLIAILGYLVVSIIPSLALQVRRWHDMGYSGWFTLLGFVPLVNYVVPFILLFVDSKREPNKWGRSPKYG